MNTLKMTLVLTLAILISACSSSPKQYTIKGEGDRILNRDITGKSLSVVVRVYQLKDAREFSKLTFDTLISGYPDSELLGPSLLEKTDVIVVPGATYASTEKLLDETKFVGIVGFFRNPDPQHWRQLVDVRELPGYRNAELTFRAQDCYIQVAGAKPLLLPGQPPVPRGDCGWSGTYQAAPPPQATYRGGPPVQRAAPPPRAEQPASGGLLQGLPEVNVNVGTPVAPTNVRVGGGAPPSVSIGNQAPAQGGYYNAPPPGYYNNAPPPGYYNNAPGYYGNQPAPGAPGYYHQR